MQLRGLSGVRAIAGTADGTDRVRADPRRIVGWILLGVVVIGVGHTIVNVLLHAEPLRNLHALQADAFLDGRVDLDTAAEDVAAYDGKFYSPYPPAPALLLAPIRALFGKHAVQPLLIALASSGVGVWLTLRIGRQLGLTKRTTLILAAGLFLGTAYWMCATTSGEVWGYSHVMAVTCMLAAFDAALRGRAGITGIFLTAAMLSRQFSICAVPFLAYLLVTHPGDDIRWLRLTRFGAPLALGVSGYLAFNAARFAGPFDTGYSHIPLTADFLATRVAEHGIFSMSYVPFNFVHMFLQGFHLDYGGPDLLATGDTDGFGTSLTFASPFLFLAFLARPPRGLLIAAWSSIGLCLVGELLYYNNGYIQTNGQRFALDFIPMLLVLVMWGVQRAPSHLWKAAVVYSVGLNFLALAVFPHWWWIVDRTFIS